MSRRCSVLAFMPLLVLFLFIANLISADPDEDASFEPPLRLTHAWIVVTPGAPERKALEKAGFRIAPTINRHDGQGTASVTVEFLNGFLELIYPDASVPISPASKVGAEKFRKKSAWRETGYSPLGLVFDRTPATPDSLPFSTWRVSADWMDGSFIEMMTPREMPTAVSLSIAAHPAATEEENQKLARDPVKGAVFHHPNETRRLTRVHVTAPARDRLPPAADYLLRNGVVGFAVWDQWLLDVTLDDAREGITLDLRPELPLLIHF